MTFFYPTSKLQICILIHFWIYSVIFKHSINFIVCVQFTTLLMNYFLPFHHLWLWDHYITFSCVLRSNITFVWPILCILIALSLANLLTDHVWIHWGNFQTFYQFYRVRAFFITPTISRYNIFSHFTICDDEIIMWHSVVCCVLARDTFNCWGRYISNN